VLVYQIVCLFCSAHTRRLDADTNTPPSVSLTIQEMVRRTCAAVALAAALCAVAQGEEGGLKLVELGELQAREAQARPPVDLSVSSEYCYQGPGAIPCSVARPSSPVDCSATTPPGTMCKCVAGKVRGECNYDGGSGSQYRVRFCNSLVNYVACGTKDSDGNCMNNAPAQDLRVCTKASVITNWSNSAVTQIGKACPFLGCSNGGSGAEYKVKCWGVCAAGSTGPCKPVNPVCTPYALGIQSVRNECKCNLLNFFGIVCASGQCNGSWCVLNTGNGRKYCDYGS
jgi:hypothetical protein